MERVPGGQWGGRQALQYGKASTARFAADAESTRAGHFLVADATVFTARLQAHSADDVRLERVLVRPFTPRVRVAFEVWLKADPFKIRLRPRGPVTYPGSANQIS